ncbi:lipopolysaccharide biosynthesis protein [Aureivirga sp. CE67]|uniref:lipopolysaccharide biosynthesis protein n=1 Tax=Aureivirga sp. CE67 TaxID=1788983 RepID=UPI0018C9FC4B|nr:oligosaccharide flippase family protein [Aureivirga sp. CE67]
MLKKIFSNSIIYGLGQHVPKLISLVLIPIITPFLTDEDYGVYGILVAYIGSTTVFKQLGFSVILSNSFYKNPLHYKFIWSRVFGFLLSWNVILSILYMLLIPLIVPESASNNLGLIILLYVLPTLFFDTIVFIGNKLLQYKQKAISFGTITAIKSIIGYLALYLAVAVYDLGYLGWLISSFTISTIGAILIGYEIFLKEKLFPCFKFNYKWLRRKFKIALPVIPHFYSVFLLTNSDRIMMDLFGVSVEKIGEYSLAYQVGGYFSLAGTALGMAYGPILMQMIKNKQQNQIQNITKVLSLVFIGGAFITALWMREIFKILVRNESLQDSYPLAMIVVFSFTYYPFYYYVNTYFQYKEKTLYLLKISFAAGILNIVLNLFMIPYFGIKGAAISTFISYLYLGYSGIFIRYFNNYDKSSYKYLGFALVTVLLFLFTNYFQDNIIIKYVSTLLIILLSIIIIYKKKKVLSIL